MDAASSHLWPYEPDFDQLDLPRYPTQRRRIERSGRLLGLDTSLSEPLVAGLRDHLGIAGLDHHLAREAFEQATSLRQRGRAILDVHQKLPRHALVARLLTAGSHGGLWGPPWLWDPSRKRRLQLLSRAAPRRGPPGNAP